MERILEWTVTETTNIENILKKRLGLTRRQISQAKFREHGICRNGIQCRITTNVVPGDQIQVILEEASISSSHLLPLAGAPQIVYEDEDLLIVDKPAGMPVHPCKGHYRDTLVNLLAYYFSQKNLSVRIRPIGRLDMDTSGLVLFAKNQTAAGRLAGQKTQGILQKSYYALVTGKLQPPSGEIHTPIGSVPHNINKMQVCPNGRPASTYYETVSVYPSTECPNPGVLSSHQKGDCVYSLLNVQITTGRTHQIRVHMASLGHPLLGDPIYNSEPNLYPIERTALHAYSLKLMQPFTGEHLTLHAPIPGDMLLFLPKY